MQTKRTAVGRNVSEYKPTALLQNAINNVLEQGGAPVSTAIVRKAWQRLRVYFKASSFSAPTVVTTKDSNA